MSNVRYLAETSVRQIQNLIKTEIAAVLLQLRTERGDAKVTTEPPQSYFIYEQAKDLKTPSVYIIARDIDFQKDSMGANHITARINCTVSVVVEDKDREKLTIKAWRYQAALHQILDQRIIEVTPDKAKLFLIITDAAFSPVFSGETAQTSGGAFRQEMALNIRVEQRESL